VCPFQCHITTLKRTHCQHLLAMLVRHLLSSNSLTLKISPPPPNLRQQSHRWQLQSINVAQSASVSVHPLRLMIQTLIHRTLLSSLCRTEVSLPSEYPITFCLKICQTLPGLISGCVKSFTRYTRPVHLQLHVSLLLRFHIVQAAVIITMVYVHCVAETNVEIQISATMTNFCQNWPLFWLLLSIATRLWQMSQVSVQLTVLFLQL